MSHEAPYEIFTKGSKYFKKLISAYYPVDVKNIHNGDLNKAKHEEDAAELRCAQLVDPREAVRDGDLYHAAWQIGTSSLTEPLLEHYLTILKVNISFC